MAREYYVTKQKGRYPKSLFRKKIILFRNFQANKLSLFTMYDILKGEANVSL